MLCLRVCDHFDVARLFNQRANRERHDGIRIWGAGGTEIERSSDRESWIANHAFTSPAGLGITTYAHTKTAVVSQTITGWRPPESVFYSESCTKARPQHLMLLAK